MVLEHIFPEDWLEQKGRYAFILGIIYSVVGLLLASILFPSDPALVAVALTSMLLLPEMYKIFAIEERKESIEKKITFGELWKDDIEVVRIYVFLFLGIILVYSLGTILLPSLQSNNLFREQLEIRLGQGFAGRYCRGFLARCFFGICFPAHLHEQCIAHVLAGREIIFDARLSFGGYEYHAHLAALAADGKLFGIQIYVRSE